MAFRSTQSGARTTLILLTGTLGAAATANAALPVFFGPGSATLGNFIPTTIDGITNSGVAVAHSRIRQGSQNPPVYSRGDLYRWYPDTRAAERFDTTFSGGILTRLTDAGTAVVNYGVTAPTAVRYIGGAATILSPLFDAGDEPEVVVADVNASGTAVGTSSRFRSSGIRWTKAVRWGAGNIPEALATFQTTFVEQQRADFINDVGTIVGQSEYIQQTSPTQGTLRGLRAVRWSSANVLTMLPLPGTPATTTGASTPLAMNTSGAVVGTASRAFLGGGSQFDTFPVRWAANGQSYEILQGLDPSEASSRSAKPTAMNNAGVAVGVSRLYASDGRDLGQRAARWAANSTTAVELQGLGLGTQGTTDSEARYVNNIGAAVGRAIKWQSGINSDYRAVLWTPGATTAIDLNALHGFNTISQSFVMTDVFGLSDTGYISGVGFYSEGSTSYQRAFTVLVPQAGTYGRGDANFDTLVDFDDLLLLAQNYGTPNGSQAVNRADFDLDGSTDFDDLLALAQNYGSGGPSLAGAAGVDAAFAGDWALARSLVPEPGTLVALAVSLLAPRRRR